MDLKIIGSPEAVEDAESIADYISRDSGVYASAVASKLVQVAAKLTDMPYSGRMVPEFCDNTIREKFVYSYRLIYRIDQNSILIIAVVHGKQILEEEKERL